MIFICLRRTLHRIQPFISFWSDARTRFLKDESFKALRGRSYAPLHLLRFSCHSSCERWSLRAWRSSCRDRITEILRVCSHLLSSKGNFSDFRRHRRSYEHEGSCVTDLTHQVTAVLSFLQGCGYYRKFGWLDFLHVKTSGIQGKLSESFLSYSISAYCYSLWGTEQKFNPNSSKCSYRDTKRNQYSTS